MWIVMVNNCLDKCVGHKEDVCPWSCVIFIIHFHACQSWTLFSCVFQWSEIAQFVTRIALFGLWLKIRSMWCWGLFGLIWVFFSAIQRCSQNSPCFYLEFMFLNDCCQQKNPQISFFNCFCNHSRAALIFTP